MFPEPNETEPSAWHRVEKAGMGALRVTLLFGSAAIALALVLAPIAESRSRPVVAMANAPFGIDHASTGSVSRETRYTIRRSVLQQNPTSFCIISNSGRRSGDC